MYKHGSMFHQSPTWVTLYYGYTNADILVDKIYLGVDKRTEVSLGSHPRNCVKRSHFNSKNTQTKAVRPPSK